jgi:hypothetical protein
MALATHSAQGIQPSPDVGQFAFDLTPQETQLIKTDAPYVYRIYSGKPGEAGFVTLESGTMLSSPPAPPSLPTPVPGDPDYSSPTSYTSYADSCQTVTGRTALVIDGYVDAMIGQFRQLKVWDEHARRRGDSPPRLQLTYEYINKYTPIEIFDGNNNPVVTSNLYPYPSPGPPSPPVTPCLGDFDYRNGNFTINGDDGNQDYFVTYTFNLFPEAVLRMFVEQTVLEMNFIGVNGGAGFLTNYTSIESIPETWLGLVALGVVAKAYKKMAVDVSIWRNWLIFDGDYGEGIQGPGGSTVQQSANDAAQYYQSMFQEFTSGTKYEKYIIGPSEYYYIFSTTGYGSFGPYVMGNKVTDGKFRGLVINKGWSY